jgi:NADH dehydrogenase
MSDSGLHVVTGAFGFSGRAITKLLLTEGKRVLTLTNHRHSGDELDGRVEVAPLNFDDPAGLARTLSGADTLYNTYWIRFEHGDTTFAKAVENSRRLTQAARDAGVRRIVHISVVKPSLDSPFPYYSGKATVEEMIKTSGLSYAILRPAVIFGDQGALINNIAWFLRHLPMFVIPGDGQYRLQPVFVEDLAELAVAHGGGNDNVILDATGPEIYTFNDLVKLLTSTVGSHAFAMHLPPGPAFIMSKGLGLMVHDIVLTRDEVRGLMANLLVSDNPPTGHTLLSQWLADNKNHLGKEYMSDLRKHYG